ncbi:hypothetical protein PR202_ga24485 [Eleusine coracana subsp. coracana]|uniref:Pentatricopeptide repeat-containing protein n=1 Tax=Eleusine coracana subsp. coracana TaxID=191504 RepID=A0AAV5D7V5_ELECO|nr:hypothetical protein PR202_ga24485 [Eleusine coracana subsp. coracana]
MISKEMVSRGVKPNSVILSSCSHSGFVTDGRKIFESMNEVYGVKPTIEHYPCVVDFLGCGEAIEEAVRFICKMPLEPSASVWGALLSACAMHNNVDVGEVALFELEEGNAGNYGRDWLPGSHMDNNNDELNSNNYIFPCPNYSLLFDCFDIFVVVINFINVLVECWKSFSLGLVSLETTS